MKQASLLDPPIARKRDPETSRRAAWEYDGKPRSKDADTLLRCIASHPGHTCAEYSELLRADGMHWYKAARMPTKRMHDLVSRGDVWAGEPRVCSVTGKSAQVYHTL